VKHQIPTTTLRYAKRGLIWSAIAAAALIAGCKSRPVSPQDSGAQPSAIPAPPAASGLPAVRNMAEYRRRAAQMILAANPGGTYAGAVSEPAYGIVVVSIGLNADGSIRNVGFLRRSSVGPDANDLAVQAVRRVGSFGPISNLAGPWDISETFFYNDARKFQLRTVVEKL
jgi:TonB family protein